MEQVKLQKIVKSLCSLLFFKDYSNCLIHGKGKFSKIIKDFYENSKEIPIISIASYDNMKIVTKSFFESKINESEVFKIINSLLFSKIEKWKENDLVYSEYLLDGRLNNENLMEDFNMAVKILENFELNKILMLY